MDCFCIDQLAFEISFFILSDNLDQIKYNLDHQTVAQKKQIVNLRIHGSTFLHKACKLQRYPIVRYFVEECNADVNLSSDDGLTPILIACSLGDVVLTDYLYNHGGNIYVLDRNLKTLLMLFIQNTELCSFLLSKHILLYAKDADGKTAFDYAISTSSLHTMELLIQRGVDVNLQNTSGHSPVHVACDMGNVDTLEFLIHYGADINAKDKNRKTYLMHFIKKYYICRVLIQNSIEINARDSDGLAAIHYTVDKDVNVQIINLLVKCGADIDAKDKNGMTAAAYAVHKTCEKNLECLLKYGTNVNSVDIFDSSLLHRAIEVNHLESVKLLISNGAEVNTCNKDGRDCIQIAALLHNSNIVEFLVNLLEVRNSSKIDAYELMASNELEVLKYEEAFTLLSSALMWRESNGSTPKQTTILNSIFENKNEPQTMDDLLNMDDNFDTILIQAALIRGRILGPYHLSVLSVLEMLVEDIDDEYDEEMDKLTELRIRKHIYSIAFKSFGATDSGSIGKKRNAVRCLYETNKDKRPTTFIFEILSDITEHIRVVLRNGTLEHTDTQSLSSLFHFCILIVYLLLVEDTNDKEAPRVRKEMQQIVSICPDNIQENFLHGLLDEILDDLSCITIVPRAFLLLLHVLLTNNVVVSSVDDKGSTILHKYLRCLLYSEISQATDEEALVNKTIEVLLQKGNHICIEDDHHETILDLLEERSYPVCSVRDRTLQCLAAEVVVNNGMSVSEDVPHLEQFLKYHKRH